MVFLLCPLWGCFKNSSFRPKLYFPRGNHPKRKICLLALSSHPDQRRCMMTEYWTYPFVSAPLIHAVIFSSLRSPLRFCSILKKQKKGKTKCSFQPVLFQYTKVDPLSLIQIQWTFPTGASITKTQKRKMKTTQPVVWHAWKIDLLQKDERRGRNWGTKNGKDILALREFCCQTFRCAKTWK